MGNRQYVIGGLDSRKSRSCIKPSTVRFSAKYPAPSCTAMSDSFPSSFLSATPE